MLGRAPRERRGILKQWPPVCVSGECDENKGCVCNKRKLSAAQVYWDTVQIIYEHCEDIPAMRPGDVPVDSLDLTCHETIDDPLDDPLDEPLDEPRSKRVRWNVTPSPNCVKNGVNRRWTSPHAVLCTEEKLELTHHDGTQVRTMRPPNGSWYENV